MGSAVGAGAAAMASIGAWKKCYAQNKAASFLLLAFMGAPLTQAFYGLITKQPVAATKPRTPTVSDRHAGQDLSVLLCPACFARVRFSTRNERSRSHPATH